MIGTSDQFNINVKLIGVLEKEHVMATERARPSHDDTLTPEQQAGIERALDDSAAGHVYDNVSTEVLERFAALDDAEAQSLLANPAALKQWFAAHA